MLTEEQKEKLREKLEEIGFKIRESRFIRCRHYVIWEKEIFDEDPSCSDAVICVNIVEDKSFYITSYIGEYASEDTKIKFQNILTELSNIGLRQEN
jgi:hypothetical protein